MHRRPDRGCWKATGREEPHVRRRVSTGSSCWYPNGHTTEGSGARFAGSPPGHRLRCAGSAESATPSLAGQVVFADVDIPTSASSSSAQHPPTQLRRFRAHEEFRAIAPPSNEPRINDRIRAREVRLVGQDGEQIGIKNHFPRRSTSPGPPDSTWSRSQIGQNPPVCRIMDFGKWKYENDQRAKESRKKSSGPDGQGDEVPTQDRAGRLRYQDQESREVPRRRSQGQGHDHVPRPRDAASRVGAQDSRQCR